MNAHNNRVQFACHGICETRCPLSWERETGETSRPRHPKLRKSVTVSWY